MKNKTLQAVIYILVGAFFIYWAQAHSPNAGMGKIAGNALSGSYTMSDTSYYITLAIGAALAVMGVLKIIKK